MSGDIIFIVQMNKTKKTVKLVSIPLADYQQGQQFDLIAASAGDEILTQTFIANPALKKVTDPNSQLFTLPPVQSFGNKWFGNYYNNAAYMHKDFCPAGWHIPSQAEFQTLIASLNVPYYEACELKLVSSDAWLYSTAEDNNNSQLSIVGSGVITATYDLIVFRDTSYLVTRDNNNIDSIYVFKVQGSDRNTYFELMSMQFCLPVRLLKDDSNFIPTFTDVDNNVYNCVQIGSQIWLKENYICSKLSNGVDIQKLSPGTNNNYLTPQFYNYQEVINYYNQ